MEPKEPGFLEFLKKSLDEVMSSILGIPGVSLVVQHCPTLLQIKVPLIANFLYTVVTDDAYFSQDRLWLMLLDNMLGSIGIGCITPYAVKFLACMCHKASECAFGGLKNQPEIDASDLARI
uniref:AlNc14C9G1208 protein n=1 Tax=Albugo laibachii Nc14 TaxID=890382 RepID=F0W2F7_9STRA|nr:AlNc14C9G1208 [Albugo laibachii Nc14]|eukprot:CCA15243.1 AlNc14C9G1208 [Albugo laibachii Nc14]